MRQFLYSVVIIFTFLGLSYLFLRLIGLDFEILIFKIHSVLLSKFFHFLLRGLGWGFLIAAILAFWDPELAEMVMPAGASGASSSEGRVNQAPLSVSDLTKATSSTETGIIIYKAPRFGQ